MSLRDLYLAKDVRALDRLIIDEFSVDGYALMTRAGQAAFSYLQQYWPSCKKITVVCGRGNNAGDGYVVARLAHEAGYKIQVFGLVGFDYLQGDALLAARAAADAGVAMIDCERNFPANGLDGNDVLVDAIFGIGLDRNVEGRWLAAINAINDSDCAVMALDIPSGLSADTGTVLGAAVKSDCTISFIALKQGLFTGHARAYCGEVHLADLAVPDEARNQVEVTAQLINYRDIYADLLLPRHECSYKSQHGHVLLVGGENGMSGALQLAGEAALRCGAGLVSLATRQQHAALLSIVRPELMCHGVEERSHLNPLLKKASLVAVGPGLGGFAWGQAMFSALLETGLPMVVDADGLNFLAKEKTYRTNWVLTPHPGEAARLLGVSIGEIEADRFSAVRALQTLYGGVVVLKGAGTLICYGENNVIDVCGDGNPGMAVAGMGDVLTGVIASLIAQKLSFSDAIRLGVCLHSAAADLAAKQGTRGMLASDLFAHLRMLINSLPSGSEI